MILGVSYLTFVSVTITVSPKSERVPEKLIVNIFDKEKNQQSNFSQKSIPGEVVQIEVSQEKKYPTTGAEILDREIKGEVRIINEDNVSHPLVANTRLLTADDKLFRIKETVNVVFMDIFKVYVS